MKESLLNGMDRLPTASKLDSRHLARLALVYIRQSSPQQVLRNQESTRLQYALQERAHALGWRTDRILVIDEDLGRSGSSTEGRLGFQRMVAEVGLDHVGAILGVEMSRFARSCRDWYQLLEMCALFGTLIIDLDGTYDPSNYNDRLLLGLKGTMSEAELHILKRRLLEGRWAKACRGDLQLPLPMGYLRRPTGEVVLEPDEHARSVVETIFTQFDRQGSVLGLLRFFNEQGLQLPVRERRGPLKGELTWHRPNSRTLGNVLKNPMYAGAYVLGRRPTDRKKQKPGRPGTGRSVTPLGKWEVFLPDRFPAFITWEQYLRNRDRLMANRVQAKGPIRQGSALVGGLLFCGRCGKKMRVMYSGRGFRYACTQARIVWQAPTCQSLAGQPLDEVMATQLMAVLQPAAIEASRRLAADLECQRVREETLWKQRLERAQFEADRARRQYELVEPENRLVARTLEGAWEEKLQGLRVLEEEHRRHQGQPASRLSNEEWDAIRNLAKDAPGLWAASTTTQVERKEMVRTLVERVIATVEGETEKVRIQVHWSGGSQSAFELDRPVRSWKQMSTWKPLQARILELQREGKTSAEIAQVLNLENARPVRGSNGFTAEMVRQIVSRAGLSAHRQEGGR